eukprot:8413996-Pyramimonas_sp.AAC.2
MRPTSAHSIGCFRSLLGEDLKTDHASMAKATSMLRPPISSKPFNRVGARGPAWSSCRVAIVG